ncbi:putative NifU-like protein 2, chloroplastic, partial [Cardiosporidium cionae]
MLTSFWWIKMQNSSEMTESGQWRMQSKYIFIIAGIFHISCYHLLPVLSFRVPGSLVCKNQFTKWKALVETPASSNQCGFSFPFFAPITRFALRNSYKWQGKLAALSMNSKSSPFEGLEHAASRKSVAENTGILPLSIENVDLVLNEIRPYLLADGGNCSIHKIEDDIVYVQLEGACGNCPSSTVTVKMGIERRLKERIPQVKGVEPVTSMADGNPLTYEGVEAVLDGIRPFLKITGGKIELRDLHIPIEGVAASASLRLLGKLKGGISHSVKLEIIQRLKKSFPILTDVKIIDGQ